MKRLQIVILLNLVFASFLIWPAYGDDEEWIFFFTNLTGDRFYYNKQSIVYGQDKTVKVLQKVVSGQVDSDIREVGTLVEFECSKLMYRRLKTATLSRNGETRNAQEPSQWNSISPASPAEKLSQELCNKVSSRARDRR